MDLVEGMRVGVTFGDVDTIVAVVRRVIGDDVELDLLEAPNGEVRSDTVVTVFASRDGGLHRWHAMPVGPPEGSRLSLTLMGSPLVVQRRSHPRFEVELPGEVLRVRPASSAGPTPVQVVDISHGGAKVEGAVTLAIGDAVVLELDIGNGLVAIGARVAMAYPDGHGRRTSHLAFDAPEDPELIGLNDYLGSLEAVR